MFMPTWVCHGYMSFSCFALTLWLVFHFFFLLSFDPILPHLPAVSSPASPPIQMPAQERSMSIWVMSNLYTSLSPCVSLYLPSILNQRTVAWAKPRVCQRITLPVCVPTSGLCFPAWLWLWSWPSMPYRSARRRKKRSSTHKLIPKAEGVISETDIKKAESLGSWHKWYLWERKNKQRWKMLKSFLQTVNLLFIWCIVRVDHNCDRAHSFKQNPLTREAMKAILWERLSLWLRHQNLVDWSWSCQKTPVLFSPKEGEREWTT